MPLLVTLNICAPRVDPTPTLQARHKDALRGLGTRRRTISPSRIIFVYYRCTMVWHWLPCLPRNIGFHLEPLQIHQLLDSIATRRTPSVPQKRSHLQLARSLCTFN